MKRKVSAVLAALLALALMLPMIASAETVTLAYTTGALNLRSGPGTNYSSLGAVRHGDHITVLEYGSVWSKVKTDGGKIGYIKNLYIKGSGSEYASGTTYYSSRFTVYTTGNVNFRAGASTGTASMGVLAKGTKLTALGENGNFYLVVNSAGTQGFVSKNYCSKDGGSTPSPSPDPTVYRTVTASAVHMRDKGGMSGNIIMTLYKGTKVKLITSGNYWDYVEYNGTRGWIKKTYLK